MDQKKAVACLLAVAGATEWLGYGAAWVLED